MSIHSLKRLAARVAGKVSLRTVLIVPFILQIVGTVGLVWLIVVIVPETDFMAQINANTRTTILLCFAALVGSTVIGIPDATPEELLS